MLFGLSQKRSFKRPLFGYMFDSVYVRHCIFWLFWTANGTFFVKSLTRNTDFRILKFLSFFLHLRLNPRGGRQTGIPVYQVLKGVS